MEPGLRNIRQPLNADVFRRDALWVGAGLLAGEPAPWLLETLLDGAVLDELDQRSRALRGHGAPGLARMSAALAGGSGAHREVRREWRRLFRGEAALVGCPWEGVYRCGARPCTHVSRCYAAAGLDELEPGVPPDHVAAELAFVASLIDRWVDALDEDARWMGDYFLREHVGPWVPRFCADLRRASPDGFYAGLADLLDDVVASSLPSLAGAQPINVPGALA